MRQSVDRFVWVMTPLCTVQESGVSASALKSLCNYTLLSRYRTIVVVPDTRIRSLRKEASQQGIRNASRMTKAELLVVLQIPIETKQ
jgi:hypothetical protein